VFLANRVRSGRKQPQRDLHGSLPASRLPHFFGGRFCGSWFGPLYTGAWAGKVADFCGSRMRPL